MSFLNVTSASEKKKRVSAIKRMVGQSKETRPAGNNDENDGRKFKSAFDKPMNSGKKALSLRNYNSNNK